MIQLIVRTVADDVAEASGWVSDVDITRWFQHGGTYTTVRTLPGTRYTLKNRYTIITSKDERSAPLNQCVRAKFGVDLRGNVLVIRHRSRVPEMAMNVHPSERQFLDFMMERCVVLAATVQHVGLLSDRYLAGS